jgi:hypothetical protein
MHTEPTQFPTPIPNAGGSFGLAMDAVWMGCITEMICRHCLVLATDSFMVSSR